MRQAGPPPSPRFVPGSSFAFFSSLGRKGKGDFAPQRFGRSELLFYLCVLNNLKRNDVMKILWIDLSSSYAHASLALPALHAQVTGRDDVQWAVVSATINECLGPVVEEAYAHRPDVVAATAWLFNHEPLLHLLVRLKALMPSCLVVLGGPEFLGDNADYLRSHPFVDALFRGEGEESFPRWLTCWDRPAAWGDIAGLCYIDRATGRYVDNGTARVGRFDALVPPEESRFFPWGKPFVQLETTRGCFNTCAFCVSGGEKPVRVLGLEAIRQRLDVIRAHGIRQVRLLDRTFNYNPLRARALLELFRTYHPDIRFHLELHPALLTAELRQLLRELPAGLLHLEAGIQSLHEEVLQACSRRGGLTEALEGLRYLCSLPNMETHADLIAGLPLYTLPQLFDDVRTLAAYRAGEIQLESLKVLPGTEMRRRAAELGICYSPYPPYEVLQTREITAAELQTARRLSRLFDAYYNTAAWQEVTRQLILHDACFLHRFLEHLIQARLIDQPMSLEKRGLVLYAYCKQVYPTFARAVSIAWIEAGMSLKKLPAERVRTKHQTPPAGWTVLYGTYKPGLRLCFLPDEGDLEHGQWFGFESEIQKTAPVFRAVT